MSDETRPTVDLIANRLSSLDKTPQMAQAAKENPEEIEKVVFQGFDELIKRFNLTNINDKDLILVPKVKALKEKLGSLPLPAIEEIGARDLIKGIREAEPLMRKGQDIKKGNLPATPENTATAIGTPSMETNSLALAIGTAGHILERSVFNFLRNQGISEWQKDEVLFALEDLTLLMHAETLSGSGHESPLFPYITTPNSPEETGGLGWRRKEQVDTFVQNYNQMHSITPVSNWAPPTSE